MTPPEHEREPARQQGDDAMNAANAKGAARSVAYLRVSTNEQARRNGEVEGYSLPAQRGAVQRKAETLNASIVEEFVEGGHTATNTQRAELQRLLAFIEAEHVDYVIVHKLDRLIRNRFDDLLITVALDKAGTQLVSCSEHIDKTPSGKFTHGLMALIAEWYSGNLSEEMKVKMQQKARAGGTIGKAAVGYLNVRTVVAGYDARTVQIDPTRAPLVQWAFETYANGNWSLRQLATELEIRGLTQRPTAERPTRPLSPI